MEAWQKGLSSLTHQSAFDKGILNGFIGNAFDFISISAEDIDLTYVVAIMQYFATFFFDSQSNVKAFEDLIDDLSLRKRYQIYACSIDQFDPNRMSQLVKVLISFMDNNNASHNRICCNVKTISFSLQPYTSLADILLSQETHPIAKCWFDQFRVVTDDDIEGEILQQQAVDSQCTILHGYRCYCEDGSIREVCHDLSLNALEDFLRNFKHCANERDTMIAEQCSKYALDKQMAKQDKRLAKLDEKKSELNFKIR